MTKNDRIVNAMKNDYVTMHRVGGWDMFYYDGKWAVYKSQKLIYNGTSLEKALDTFLSGSREAE